VRLRGPGKPQKSAKKRKKRGTKSTFFRTRLRSEHMPQPIKVGRKERMTFAKIHEVCEMPNLIDIQTKSYKWFIEEGLAEVLEDVSTYPRYHQHPEPGVRRLQIFRHP